MFKLFHKKLNKKGFTLAELLVVVAIIAILVAIAIPIFMNALRQAQLRTNEANIRAVKAEGVTQILANWDKKDSGDTNTIASGVGEKRGWFVLAKVTPTGDINDLKIYSNTGNWKTVSPDLKYQYTGISTTATATTTVLGPFSSTDTTGKEGSWAKNKEGDLNTNLQFISSSKTYVVQVHLTDEELNLKDATT